MPAPDGRRAALRDDARRSLRGLGLGAAESSVAARSGPRRLRRGPRGRALLRLTLVDEDGVLRWIEGPAAEVEARVDVAARRGPRRRLRDGRRLAGGDDGVAEIHHVDFERLAPSEITAHLDRLDTKLTPRRGLRRWTDAGLVPVDRPSSGAGDRVLLVVHGTFSNGEAIVNQVEAAPGGRAFLQAARRMYDEILTFDHPTLAVSPVLNAWDLEQALGGCAATFDVVAHSRGGLVARAWAAMFRGGTRGVGRLVFVGAPLDGTSLAAPPRLRESLEYVANLGGALRAVFAAGAVNPFLAVGAGLMQVIASVTSVAARTPLLDAAVAMIPGLAAQSRIGNNHEVLRLRASRAIPADRCFAIRADFEPPKVGWAFWKLFSRPRDRLADFGADLLFPDTNDLVVDCSSTFSLGPRGAVPARQTRDFGTQSTVHHCNYFAQRATLEFLGEVLFEPR